MKVRRSDLQQLISNEAKILDNKAEIVAEDIKRDLLKQKIYNYGWWVKWLLGVIVLAWASFKFQFLESTMTPEFTGWFDMSDENFPNAQYVTEKYGFNIGRPVDSPTTIEKSDILLRLQYPYLKDVYEVLAIGKHLSHAGALFLRQIVSEKGTTLRYEHWNGSQTQNDVNKFLPTFHVGDGDCHDQSKMKESSILDFVSIMENWASKRYAKGHPKEFQDVEKPFCELDFDGVYDGIDDSQYICHYDSQVKLAYSKGHRIYKLTPEQKRYGIEHKNPWADFFGFADANELAQNQAIQEHLCSPSSKTTLLSILFKHGLVGVATYYATDIDTNASELVERLIGSYGNPDLVKSMCTSEKLQSAVDGFALVSGIGVAIAGGLSHPLLQRTVAGMSMMGGGGLAYTMYNSTKCSYKEV